MKATIISIGDELLIGQTTNTNATWIGSVLEANGIKCFQVLTIGDTAAQIKAALSQAEAQSDLVVITGGLGPTKDDITKKVLCEFFGMKEVLHEPSYQKLVQLFESRGKVLLEINKSQAMLPAGCTVIPNDRGTAPGMWFEQNNTIFVSMPGVPFEMKNMFQNEIIPRIKAKGVLPTIVHKNLMVVGIGESAIAEILTDFENNLPATIKLAYLPDLGTVKLRLSTILNETTSAEIDKYYDQMHLLLEKYVFATKECSLQEAIGNLLMAKNKKMAAAESCTGGYLGHLITSTAGSSAYFIGSMVTYSYESKQAVLNVSAATLQKDGAVSESCVKEMLQGLLALTKADVGVAISGVAGPDGGTDEKPVGTVCFAVGDNEKIKTYTLKFFKQREQNIRMAAITALNLIRLHLKEN